MSEVDRLEHENATSGPIGMWVRWCLRANPWPLLLLALLLHFGYFWEYRSPTVAMVGIAYYNDFCFGSFLFGLLAAGRVVQVFVRNTCEARFGVHFSTYRSRRWFWPWLVVIAAGTYYMVWSQLPMYVSFLLSRSALDRVADEALADRGSAHLLAGRWAGLYRIAGVEVIGSTVVLYLGEDRGTYGFARVPGAGSDVIYNRPAYGVDANTHQDFPEEQGWGEPEGKRITGDWFVMYSWYRLVKVGWS